MTRKRPLLTVGLALVLLEPAFAQKPVVEIAFVANQRGDGATNGISGGYAAELAVLLRNKRPDTRYHYRLTKFDDQCDFRYGVPEAIKMATDSRFVAAVAHYCSSVAIKTVDVFHKYGMPIVVWGAVLPEITHGNNYREVNRINGTQQKQNQNAANFMVAEGFRKWLVLFEESEYGRGHLRYFTAALQEVKDVRVLEQTGISPSDPNVANAVRAAMNRTKPDVILIAGLSSFSARVYRAIRDVNSRIQIQATSGAMSNEFLQQLKNSKVETEGLVAFRDGPSTRKLTGGETFLKEYGLQGYKEPADVYATFAYAATQLVMEGVEKVGSDRRALTQYLVQVKDVPTLIGNVTFDVYGQNLLDATTVFVVQDGEWIEWEESDYAPSAGRKRKLVH
jgi:branched-chain amino acid transport system substrate-binding protein